MPTPMPIIDASWVAKSGVAMTWLTSSTSPIADADAEQRDEDRQTHREQRAERDQQDHDGGEDADELGRSEAAGTPGTCARRARSRTPAPAASSARCRMSLIVRSGIFVGRAVELHGGVGDPAVTRDLTGALGRVRAHHRGHARDPRHLGEERLHAVLHGGSSDAIARRRTRSGPRRRPARGSATGAGRSLVATRCPTGGSPGRTSSRRSTRPRSPRPAPRSTGPRPVAGAGRTMRPAVAASCAPSPKSG